MSKPAWIIVGAGFTGAVVAERIASVLDERVLVVDRRDHIAGNAYDYRGENGLLIHKYGPHIFHTNSKRVWDYLSRFTEWRNYFHKVLGHIDGQLVPVPFNLNSIAQLFPSGMADRLSEKLVARYGFGTKVPILKMRADADEDLKFLSDYVYRKVFETYTLKQWELRPEELDPSVSARVPVHVSRDDRYFQDSYQAMPVDGYTAMFRKILNHQNISVELSTNYKDVCGDFKSARVIYTGPIDEYFNYSHGQLPYRSLQFKHVPYSQEFAFPVGTVNYPNEFDFTRVTETKHLTGDRGPLSLLTQEYPEAYVPGTNEPYYPIPTTATSEALRPYRNLARELDGQVWFAGRLGDYAYYNMDQACARAIALFDKQIAPVRQNGGRGQASRLA
ncbi:UDP-galactopyranose mutase [Methylobacterium sp. J-077]|uniref:UDP-galactopyranose mutase n=1 Tax=Methylobacterium sp. J-077 TaxID=2836656 RepID=UPI001FB9D2C8|nr:UDP-galactopyranose mutase [Methylobacterium sp. J-077]MCJ2121686.1 UDP-galactopyranose mutase [Methylobacterium sp. J-077]